MSERIVDNPANHGWVEENGKWVWDASGGGSGGGGGAGVLMSDTEPTDKTEGMMWMDTSTSPAVVWVWDGAAWVEFPFVGGGGSDGSGGGSGPKLPELQYLVIGGGGNGGYNHRGTYVPNDKQGMPGGGGAGGYRTNVPGDRSGGDTDPEVTPSDLLNIPAYSQFRIIVGAGGEARTSSSGSDWEEMPQNGQPSAIQDVDGNPIIQSEGGGAGASVWKTTAPSLYANDGGSGGGGAGGNTGSTPQADRNGSGTSGQGSDGANRGSPGNSNVAGGGAGGGAGGLAFSADGTNNRDGMSGGPGLVSSIDGLNKERAGGGAGKGGRDDGTATAGGGQAGSSNAAIAIETCSAEPHTGGGAGAYHCTNTGPLTGRQNAPGGSGVAIVRYFGPQVCFGGEVTTHDGYTVHTFKSDGIFTVGSLT